MTKNRMLTGQGRVEFLSNSKEIYELLSKGHTITSVYRQLKNTGQLTLSYASFAHLLRCDKLLKKTEESTRKNQDNEKKQEENKRNVTISSLGNNSLKRVGSDTSDKY